MTKLPVNFTTNYEEVMIHEVTEANSQCSHGEGQIKVIQDIG